VPQLGLGDIGDSIGRTFTPVGMGQDGKMKAPKGMKLLGPVDKQLQEEFEALRQEKGQTALAVAQSISGALADGFTSAFNGDENFFAALGKSLLQSLGNILMQIGASMITYGALMTPLAGIPGPWQALGLGAMASLAAGIGLMALGAGMGALAGGGKNGSGGGGGASSTSSKPPEPNEYAVAFDPDRKLKKNTGSAVGQTSRPLGNAPMPDARPVVNIGVLNTLTPDNAQWQRTVVESYNNGIMRGMKRAG
jgi:hypothetical protein